MIRHILLATWKADASESEIAALIRDTRALRELPFIADLQCGPKLGLVADSQDFALTIDFATEAEWQAYQADPQHAALAARVRPLVASFTRIQLTID